MQHQRAHNDPVALNYTFYQIISAGPQAPQELHNLQSRCLNPGLYSTHLERWLMYFPSGQVQYLYRKEEKALYVPIQANGAYSREIPGGLHKEEGRGFII